jgi:predicted nucleotidyltransferase/DNA-binding Lrp family transcriptional regulator
MENGLAQYTWATCPHDVHSQIINFVDTLEDLLGDKLTGIYLHGSLALGGFNPDRSDIDLLIVAQESISPAIKREIGKLVLETSGNPRPLELSVLTQANLHPWRYPTPFDFHYSEHWRTETQTEIDSGGYQAWAINHPGDPDLAGHIMITNHCGICLKGKPAAEVLPSVPVKDYLASVLNDVLDAPKYIQENPLYWILNPPRVYSYLLDGKIRSKDHAGAWAIEFLPEIYRPIVQMALRTYRGEIIDAKFDASELQSYADYITEKIRSTQTPS